MKKNILLLFASVLFINFISFAQTDSLKLKIERIISSKNAVVGVGIAGIEDNYSCAINAGKRLPMQSVFKFHIALAVLNLAAEGKFSLDHEIFIKKEQLLPDTWSPIRDKYPGGNVKLPLAEILKYTVAQSDNNGCDILLGLIGGAQKAQEYVTGLGIDGVNICAGEAEMHKDWNVQYTNWSTPESAAALLKEFYVKKLPSPAAFEFLWNVMAKTSTGVKRLKGNLPEGTPVAHKTGSSGASDEGLSAATNDIGIVTLPDGRHFAIAVFVSDSWENNDVNEKIIADIAKAAWDYFVK